LKCILVKRYDPQAGTGGAPGGHEEVDLVAAIEADAEGIAFEDAVHLREGGGG
jgi:hypothetical protein